MFKPIPQIGNTYYAYDDGKLGYSRQYEVIVLEIIPRENFNNEEVLEIWKRDIDMCDWLYAQDTDYFVKVYRPEDRMTDYEWFVRTVCGGWFGIGDNLYTGMLDVDNSMTEEYNERHGLT